VDTGFIARGGDRVGVYYLEKGASQRPSKVIYDRAGSAFATASAADFDWERVLEGASWFHFTGITPALGDSAAQLCEAACAAAGRKGVTVSCDLNYRKTLWPGEKAGQVMDRLCRRVDVCIANEEDAKDVFGIEARGSDIAGGTLNSEGYKDVAKALADRFGFRAVAITLRGSVSASENNWRGLLYSDGKYYMSREYNIKIVDRVGGGDSFGAGLIYGLLSGKSPGDALEFAVAAGCLKHSVEGDFNHVSAGEVESLAGGDASGRVRR
jgi:2-dehydro-3-deoxygluconokinase